MDGLAETLIQLIVIIAIFLILVFIGGYASNKLKGTSNRYFNPKEFLPEDEIHTLKQVGYLILLAGCFVNVLYSLVFIGGDLIYFVIFDVALSLFIAVTLDKSSLLNKVLILLLVPYGSFSYVLFGIGIVTLVDLIHIPIFLYFVVVYYDKFRKYTDSNGLGITILLLFSIVFISFLITQVVEGVNPLDALVMVSNAFTSNGYSILGDSILGKVSSIFLVWGGYIISGAGTATLTAAILIRHFNKRFEELEKIIGDEGEDNG